ncbi:MAG: hypothetical protein WC809_15910 [Sinimarinibacterium sp.]|jgi:hypothetical protein
MSTEHGNTDREDEALPQLRGLRLEQMPEHDLWPGIEARMKAGSLARRPRALQPWLGYALAASVVAALTIGLWREAPGPQPAPTATTVAFAPAAQLGRVHPQQQALLKANLGIVKDAERQLQHALEQDPDSQALQRMLQSVRDQRGVLKARLHKT